MRKVIIALILTFAMLIGVGAARAAELKIGYVDTVKVFNDYQKTKDYDQELQDKQKKKEEERDKKVDELKKLQDQYVLLSDEEKEKKKGEIEKKAKELDEFRKTTVMDLRKKQGDFMNEIVEEIDKLVTKIATEQGFDYVLSAQAVLYKKDAFDFTDKVLEELNKSYKK